MFVDHANEHGSWLDQVDTSNLCLEVNHPLIPITDVNVKNNEQLIKMAGIAQRAATNNGPSTPADFFDPAEIQQLLEEQRAVQVEGQKLLQTTETIQHQIENK